MDPTLRFSSRVQNYLKYRPHYPPALIDCLNAEGVLSPTAVVADIGSGTGFLAELFLKNGNPVYGIEPNREMREAGERYLQAHAQFTSLDATAETTPLPNHSIDLITAGQAFHWFDRDKAREEFNRILRPEGWVVLIWNDRRTASTPFLMAYEGLLQAYATDYAAVDHKQVTDEVIGSFFRPRGFRFQSVENSQSFGWEGLRGRLLSSSYAPDVGHPSHEPMLRELAAIFAAHQVNGHVSFEYDTKMYYGQW